MKTDFPLLLNHPELIYLNHAATTALPSSVLDKIMRFLTHEYDTPGRSIGPLSEDVERMYQASKQVVADWVGCQRQEVIYTASATESANLLVHTLIKNHRIQKGDRVILGISEHHAVLVPWIAASQEVGFELVYLGLDQDYHYDFEALTQLITPRTRVVSLQYASNVTWAIHDLGNLRNHVGPDCLIISDITQMVSHSSVDLRALDIDFAFFSGHKMHAINGIGVLCGKQHLLKELIPAKGGGGAINWVKRHDYEAAGLPDRWEPGSLNTLGAYALAEAIAYLKSRPYDGAECVIYFCGQVKKHFNSTVELKHSSFSSDLPIFSLAIPKYHVSDIAEALARENIAVRAGHHCTQPLHDSWGVPGTLRISCGRMNDLTDIEKALQVLRNIVN